MTDANKSVYQAKVGLISTLLLLTFSCCNVLYVM